MRSLEDQDKRQNRTLGALDGRGAMNYAVWVVSWRRSLLMPRPQPRRRDPRPTPWTLFRQGPGSPIIQYRGSV